MSPPDFPISKIDEPLRISGKQFCEGENVCFVKAVTFGPFPAGAFPDEGRGQLARIREELGGNAIRLFEIPTLDFLHTCAEEGLRVFITLPWNQHIAFTRERQALAEADQRLLETIERFRGHPAIAGYFVANEIESTLVRWMGWRKVREQLERLIDLGHANDPDSLFAYANYPTTEYLQPRNADFAAFNVYLEDRESFASYLARLQNIAGDRPLLLSEFGVDSQSHGEELQAEMVSWHLDEACRAGVAGTTIFAWSDLWQRGGRTIEEYDFGLTRRDRSTKPAMASLRERWSGLSRASDRLNAESAALPNMSVIVCTYRGSLTLVECLDSLCELDYPNLELIVVNDGGDRRVQELAESYDEIQVFSIEHVGLSEARNYGAEKASGEFLVYTDDDCIVEPDWLSWVALQFRKSDRVACAGGPNIPPRAEDARQAMVAAAPGGPAHVLLTDTTAEHLPGCNLAVRKSVWEEVGGFNPLFRSAGDDVDFCWRVIEAGYELSFHAAAFVWHHRRFTVPAYLKQQIGYGKAEALLLPVHRDRFKGLGGAVWEGAVYSSRSISRGVIYHGIHGYAPFQLIYPDPDSGLSEVSLHLLWWVIALIAACLGFFLHPAWFLAIVLMIAGTATVSWKRAARAPIDPAYDSFFARAGVAVLVATQGFVRSGARFLHGWKEAKWSRGAEVLGSSTLRTIFSTWWKLGDEKNFWSEKGVGRDELLAAIQSEFPDAKDDPTGKTDVIVREGALWNWAVLTATEYHEDEKRLTRLRLLARPQPAMRVIVLLGLLVLPALVFLGYFGLQSELITLAIAYAIGSVLARVFMRLKRPRFFEIADSVGLEPV